MPKSMRRTPAPLLILLAAFALGSCADLPVAQEDPAQLFKEAQEEVANDHYMLAIDKLRAIKNKFAYSKYAVEAQLLLADVYFLQESYAEAAAVYESFRDLHPRHEKIAHATFRIGKCYFKDTPEAATRDLASAESAVAGYREFLKRFPSDPLAPEAAADLAEMEGRLAEKELKVGDFYARHGHVEAARSRWNRVIEKFPRTKAADQARTGLLGLEKKASGQGAGE